jgi:SdrD B-like protein
MRPEHIKNRFAYCLCFLKFRPRTGQVLLTALILGVATLSWGCAGFVSGQNSQPNPPPPPPQTYSISGTISPTAGGSGATVTLSGAATATTTTNSSGAYTFTGLANGSYAITPSNTGYTFSPTSQNAPVNGANVMGINFTATANGGSTFSISGTISPVAGGSGATVALSGAASANAIADASGNYIFSGLANGVYTVTPSNTGYTFSPANQSVTVNGANQPGVNFTATAQQTHSATLSWTASTSVSGYNVYRGATTGGPYSIVNGSSLVTLLTFKDSNVVSGQIYFYVVTAVDANGNESNNSNEVQAAIP